MYCPAFSYIALPRRVPRTCLDPPLLSTPSPTHSSTLYTPFAQRLVAKHFYRPFLPEFADAEDIARFPKVKLITVDEAFGGWQKAQAEHFSDGGTFDRIYTK